MRDAGAKARRDQYYRRLILLISVGWVPPYCDPSRACLTLGTRIGRSRLLTSSRVTRKPGPHPDADPRRGDGVAQLIAGTSLAIAHMNAINSRAMAVTATLGCLPRAVSRRKRLHKRTCAFHPMSWSGFGSVSMRR